MKTRLLIAFMILMGFVATQSVLAGSGCNSCGGGGEGAHVHKAGDAEMGEGLSAGGIAAAVDEYLEEFGTPDGTLELETADGSIRALTLVKVYDKVCKNGDNVCVMAKFQDVETEEKVKVIFDVEESDDSISVSNARVATDEECAMMNKEGKDGEMAVACH